jgi:hypothetical protein
MAVDFNILKYFKSLHLLPRVIFFVGLVLLLGGGFSRIWAIPVGGIGITFLGVGYNLAEDSFFHEFGPPYPLRISGANLFRAFIAFGIAGSILYIVIYSFYHGALPSWLLPHPRPVDVHI